jgi:hypothetical protein
MASYLNELKSTNKIYHEEGRMAQIRIAIIDQNGGTKTTVELPDDVPMNQLIPALVESLQLPTHQGRNLLTYRLDNLEDRTRIGDDETLSEAGIEAGTALSLLPEVTAGQRGLL